MLNSSVEAWLVCEEGSSGAKRPAQVALLVTTWGGINDKGSEFKYIVKFMDVTQRSEVGCLGIGL